MRQLIYSNLDWEKTDFYKNPAAYEEDKKQRMYVKFHIDILGNAKVDFVRAKSIECKREIKRVI